MPENDYLPHPLEGSHVPSQLLLGSYYLILVLASFHVIYQVWPTTGAPEKPKSKPETTKPLEENKNPAAGQANATPASAAAAGAAAGTDPKSSGQQAALTPPSNTSPSSDPGKGQSETDSDQQPASTKEGELTLFKYLTLAPTPEVRLILLVLVVGTLGSAVHAITSLVDYIGNKKFVESWTLWYLMRPFVGMSLALIFYFVVRAGFITAQTTNDSSAVNPFGIATLAALAGMFSKQATDKLNEVFTTFFKTASGGDAQRKDKLVNAKASIKSIDPTQVKKGAKNVQVVLTGTSFTSESVIRVNNVPRKPSAVNLPTSLTIDFTDAETANAGVFEISVSNPTQSSQGINKVLFTVIE